MLVFLFIIIPFNYACAGGGGGLIFQTNGNLNLAVVINSAENSSQHTQFVDETLISSAIWVTERLNFLEYASPFNVGVSIYKTERDKGTFEALFDLFKDENDYFLGVVTDDDFSEEIRNFSSVLGLKVRKTQKFYSGIVRAAVVFLGVLGWTDRITLFVPESVISNEFYKYSRRQWICVSDCIIYKTNLTLSAPILENPVVFFGKSEQINTFIENLNNFENSEAIKLLVVPTDGSIPGDVPENSYVIIPPQVPLTKTYKTTENILPSPLLFEIAHPIITFTQNVQNFVLQNCNNTTDTPKLECFKNKFVKNYKPSPYLNPNCILNILKIEPLKPNFVYNIFRVENATLNSSEFLKNNHFHQPFTKIFSFNIFDNSLTLFDFNFEANSTNSSELCRNDLHSCLQSCQNFKTNQIKSASNSKQPLKLRSESWVLAFLSVSALGILFCVAILLFLLTSLCKRDVLEGNPFCTVILLLTVICMYGSVLTICIEGNAATQEIICLSRIISITLSYSGAFSLILSRSILLATAAKEIGFMSHIAGPVQSFLTLFIFGVQVAINLQVLGHCCYIFTGFSFVYLISYDAMLILLLMCLTPLIVRSQRNYKEGRYFTVAVCLVFCAWAFWLTCYAFLGQEWKDPMLCLGLVSTASILIGAIFIPRTYLMTIAAARNRLASTFPSFGTNSSAIDVYRAQPVYDCVNVAAINAVNVARAGVNAIAQPDLYSSPPDEDVFDVRNSNCPTPTLSNDKVTRF